MVRHRMLGTATQMWCNCCGHKASARTRRGSWAIEVLRTRNEGRKILPILSHPQHLAITLEVFQTGVERSNSHLD